MLAHDAREVLAPGGYLLIEMLHPQGGWIADYLEELGYEAEIAAGETSGYIELAARWAGPPRT